VSNELWYSNTYVMHNIKYHSSNNNVINTWYEFWYILTKK